MEFQGEIIGKNKERTIKKQNNYDNVSFERKIKIKRKKIKGNNRRNFSR